MKNKNKQHEIVYEHSYTLKLSTRKQFFFSFSIVLSLNIMHLRVSFRKLELNGHYEFEAYNSVYIYILKGNGQK